MRKLISFSLFGTNPQYLQGAIHNAALASVIYPDWTCIFFVGPDVPADVVAELDGYGCLIRNREPKGTWEPTLWRFLAACEPGVERIIFRDADSRLNPREKAAVDLWIHSDRAVHLMFDHEKHVSPIMAGMWGVTSDLFPDMDEIMDTWTHYETKGSDEAFLKHRIFPELTDPTEVLIHSSRAPQPHFGMATDPFPATPYARHVGQKRQASEVGP